jgi:hypothetical protein
MNAMLSTKKRKRGQSAFSPSVGNALVWPAAPRLRLVPATGGAALDGGDGGGGGDEVLDARFVGRTLVSSRAFGGGPILEVAKLVCAENASGSTFAPPHYLAVQRLIVKRGEHVAPLGPTFAIRYIMLEAVTERARILEVKPTVAFNTVLCGELAKMSAWIVNHILFLLTGGGGGGGGGDHTLSNALQHYSVNPTRYRRCRLYHDGVWTSGRIQSDLFILLIVASALDNDNTADGTACLGSFLDTEAPIRDRIRAAFAPLLAFRFVPLEYCETDGAARLVPVRALVSVSLVARATLECLYRCVGTISSIKILEGACCGDCGAEIEWAYQVLLPLVDTTRTVCVCPRHAGAGKTRLFRFTSHVRHPPPPPPPSFDVARKRGRRSRKSRPAGRWARGKNRPARTTDFDAVCAFIDDLTAGILERRRRAAEPTLLE